MQVEYRFYVRRADALEHLIRPAKGVRGDDDVVEFQNRVVGVRRFRVEDVQARAGNTSFLQGLGQGLLVDDGPACEVDEKGRPLHQSEPPGVDKVPGL